MSVKKMPVFFNKEVQPRTEIILYGVSGSGKTPIAATIFEHPSVAQDNTLFVDFDLGLRSIPPSLYPENVATIENYRNLEQLVKWLRQEEHGFTHCVVDSLTVAYDLIMDDVLSGNNRADTPPQIQDYRLAGVRVMGMLKHLRKVFNVIVLLLNEYAWEDKRGLVNHKPLLPGELPAKVCARADFILHVVKKPRYTVLETNGTSTMWARDRWGVFDGKSVKGEKLSLLPIIKEVYG